MAAARPQMWQMYLAPPDRSATLFICRLATRSQRCLLAWPVCVLESRRSGTTLFLDERFAMAISSSKNLKVTSAHHIARAQRQREYQSLAVKASLYRSLFFDYHPWYGLPKPHTDPIIRSSSQSIGNFPKAFSTPPGYKNGCIPYCRIWGGGYYEAEVQKDGMVPIWTKYSCQREGSFSMTKTTKKKKAKVSKGKKVAVYSCSTCGKVAKTRSHLCSPVKAEQVYVCGFCGASTGDPRHVCAPMVAEMKYACKQCGRVTPFRGAVCQPRAIR